GELRVDPKKVKSIINSQTPTGAKKTQSFVAVVQYMQKFIPGFSMIVSSLHTVATKSKSFYWGKEQEKSFELFKYNISHAPVLSLPNLQQPFEVETNASDYAMGAVLLQE
ncbi:hypothetical protein KI387_025536, partial [Taxus chinensis]